MTIKVVTSLGDGHTLLSSFDGALNKAGVYNYNLIPLSSIVPPGSKVVKTRKYKTPLNEYGHKLYVVMAEERSQETGKFIAAGIGWYQGDDGRGVFVEHHVIGETKIAVKSEIELKIKNSLSDMCKFRRIEAREHDFKSAVSIAEVKHKPTCVLAIAVYQSEGWR